jgi:hypothetical protein
MGAGVGRSDGGMWSGVLARSRRVRAIFIIEGLLWAGWGRWASGSPLCMLFLVAAGRSLVKVKERIRETRSRRGHPMQILQSASWCSGVWVYRCVRWYPSIKESFLAGLQVVYRPVLTMWSSPI